MITFIEISPITDGLMGGPEGWRKDNPRLVNLAAISQVFPLRNHLGGKIARIDIERNSLYIDEDDHRRVLAAFRDSNCACYTR